MDKQPLNPKADPVHFVRCPDDEIQRRAENEVRKGLKEATSGMSFASCASIGWMPLIGTIAFFFGPVGIAIGIMFWVLSVGFFVFGGGAFLWGHVGALDPQKVAGARYKWRNMSRGNCPICNCELVVSPAEETTKFRCVKCRTLLQFENQYVWPA